MGFLCFELLFPSPPPTPTILCPDWDKFVCFIHPEYRIWCFLPPTTSSSNPLPSRRLRRCSLLPYPFNQSQKVVSLFIKRYKNVSATENTISLFSSSRRQDVARVLSVGQVRFRFLPYNQSNVDLPGPAMSQPSQRDLAANLTRAALTQPPGEKLTIPGTPPLLRPPPGPSSIFGFVKMKEIHYDWFTGLGSSLLNDFMVQLISCEEI